MTKTTIKIWRGLRTIGGNIAEIRHGKDRVIFDFGLVFDPAGSMLGDSTGRESKYVHDLLRLGMIPNIDGIYAAEDLQDESFYEYLPQAAESSDWNTGIFISHLHLDHMGAIRAISPHVPLYMSHESVDLYETLITIGEEEKNDREINRLNKEETVEVGEIKVTPFRVDHDVTGSLSLLIETPDFTTVYSGDFRMHGKYPEWNEAWVQALEKKSVDVLFVEGTTFRPEEDDQPYISLCETEKEVAEKVAELNRETKGLSIFNIYHRNIDRIANMIEGGKQSGRKVILEAETAYVADNFLDHPEFLIMDTKKDMLPGWKKDLFEKYDQITAEEINKAPEDYFLQNGFHLLMNLLDYDLRESIYLHSNGMPLGAFDPNYQKLQAFLERLGVNHQVLDVSGHASQEEVLKVIDRVSPEVLIPWHSHFPELVKPLNKEQKVLLPENQVTYIFENNQLVPKK